MHSLGSVHVFEHDSVCVVLKGQNNFVVVPEHQPRLIVQSHPAGQHPETQNKIDLFFSTFGSNAVLLEVGGAGDDGGVLHVAETLQQVHGRVPRLVVLQIQLQQAVQLLGDVAGAVELLHGLQLLQHALHHHAQVLHARLGRVQLWRRFHFTIFCQFLKFKTDHLLLFIEKKNISKQCHVLILNLLLDFYRKLFDYYY